MTMQPPEWVQGAPQPQAALNRLDLARPFESGAQIGMRLSQTRDPEALMRPSQLRRSLLRERAVIVGMA